MTEDVLASAIEIGVADGKVAKRVKLLSYGTFAGRDGRGPWTLDGKEHAESVIATTRQFYAGTDMMFDYDHQSALAAVPGVGGTAKAAGWIKTDTLTAEEDGIWANVEWTAPAEAALEAKEYRYHSPYFFAERGTGRITRIRNSGLTNSPNLELPALASQQPGASSEGESMKQIALAPLVSALALAANAGEAEVLAAIGELKDKADAGEAVLASARTTLGLGTDADGEAVLAAVGTAVEGAKDAGDPDPTKYVPKAGYDELKARVDKLDEDRILAMVDAACEAGKLPPSDEMRKWAIDLGRKDEAALNSYLGNAPAFPGAKPTVQGDPKPEKGKLTEEEAAICAMLGVSEADYLKTRDEEEAV
ncbi:MAG: phage protease [Novosphingobium sp.]